MKSLQDMSSIATGSSQRSLDMRGSSALDDHYNLEQDTTELKKKMMTDQDEDDTPQNSFLNVFDANKVANVLLEEAAGPSEIKLTPGEQQTGEKHAPMIKELQSITFAD